MNKDKESIYYEGMIRAWTEVSIVINKGWLLLASGGIAIEVWLMVSLPLVRMGPHHTPDIYGLVAIFGFVGCIGLTLFTLVRQMDQIKNIADSLMSREIIDDLEFDGIDIARIVCSVNGICFFFLDLIRRLHS